MATSGMVTCGGRFWKLMLEVNLVAVALYRRYRPDNFDDLIGQEHVTDLLKNALDSGRSTHAYLFSGPRGCGKTTSARIMARCLNCVEGPTATPCGVCESCVDLASGGPGSLDVVEIDAASNRGVDDARDLRERAAFAPSRDRYKIFILDEAHMVTKEGSNALLKIVEEPPEHVKFIFATTEPEKVIGTIRSRTHHYPFRLVGPQILEPYLASLCEKEGVTVQSGVLDLVIRAGGGSVRDSLSVLDQLIAGSGPEGLSLREATGLLGFTSTGMLEDMTAALSAQDGFRVFQLVEEITRAGIDPTQLTKDLLQMMRDLVVCGLVPAQAAEILPHIPADQLQRMLDQAVVWGVRDLSRSADMVDEALRTMSGTMSDRLQLELLLGRLLAGAAQPVEPPRSAAPASAPPSRKEPTHAPAEPEPRSEESPARVPERPAGPVSVTDSPSPAPKAAEPKVDRLKPAVASSTGDNRPTPPPTSDPDPAASWAQVTEKASQISKVTGAVVAGTRPVQLVDGVLSVSPPPGLRARLAPGSPDFANLEAIVGEVYGAGTQLRLSDGNEPSQQTASAARPRSEAPQFFPPKSSAAGQARSEPASEGRKPPTAPAPVVERAPEPEDSPAEPEELPESRAGFEPVPQPDPAPEPNEEPSAEPLGWDQGVSADDETVDVAPSRGVPAVLEVLGGTIIDEQEEM